ncbi:hypothetical protein CNEO4_780129 [Clostridium neonatale]|nr:hypothetical protein CNEO2_100103 [Clostridium neonatale]CAI3208367.1 hypothetical protein CNEO2_390005 [Clostridium neonatale]CAI3694378.1 hypothetical protein CNEO4_780129 [Clostridium neonatale]
MISPFLFIKYKKIIENKIYLQDKFVLKRDYFLGNNLKIFLLITL